MVNFINRHKTTLKAGSDWIREDIDYELDMLKTLYLPKFKEKHEDLSVSSVSNNSLLRFFDSEFIKNDPNASYTLLSYSTLFGFEAYRSDYISTDDTLIDSFTHTGEPAKRSLREHKLLEHHLLDYIQTALILRNKKAMQFYATLQIRNSIPGRYYFVHDRDFEHLLILLCGKANEEIQTHLLTMKSKDYLQSLLGLPFQTTYLIPYLQSLFLPLIDVYLALLLGREDMFNETLYVALLKHKAYYESEENGESRSSLPQGWVSLPLTAVCALAHDRGLKREVESDYIPEWLVKGEFEGLALTVE
ncbi:MAG: immunity 49 family protein [Bacteroidota bacterium]